MLNHVYPGRISCAAPGLVDAIHPQHGIAKNDNNNDTNQTTNPTMQPPTANKLMTRMPAYVTHLGCAVNPL